MYKKLLIILVCIATSVGCGQSENNEKLNFSYLNPSRDFTLVNQEGHPFQLKDHRNKVVLLFFGYLTCPDVCPTMLSKLTRVYKLLNQSNIGNVLTVFVSVDPERDTSPKLKEYLEYFDINAVGLTGTKQEIDVIVDAYKANYEKVQVNSAVGYLYNHSDYLYLINKQGEVCHLFRREDSVDKIVEIIKMFSKK